MVAVVGLVFIGMFVIVALPWIGIGAEKSRLKKDTVVRLNTALAHDRSNAHELAPDVRKMELLSAIPWLNRKLLRLALGPRLRDLLAQANLGWTAGTLLTGCAVCFVIPACIIYALYGAASISLVAGTLCGSAPLMWVQMKRKNRFEKFLQEMPEALELMVGAIRAGHSLIAAMGLVGAECPEPVGSEFKLCFEEQNYGLEMKTALDNLVTRVPLQELKIVTTAIMIQKESGGNLAEVLDKTTHVIRERFRLKRQVGTYTAQGRLTGWILTLLPVGLGVILYFLDPSMISILWTNPTGIKLLWASSVMMSIGGLIIRNIVNMDV
jgi:tight adherence protein B